MTILFSVSLFITLKILLINKLSNALGLLYYTYFGQLKIDFLSHASGSSVSERLRKSVSGTNNHVMIRSH